MDGFVSNVAYCDAWGELIEAMLTAREESSRRECAQRWEELVRCESATEGLYIPMLAQRLGLTDFERFAVMLTFCAHANVQIELLAGRAPDLAMAVRLYETYREGLDRYALRASLRIKWLMEDGRGGKLRLTEPAFQILCGFFPDLPGCTHMLHSELPMWQGGTAVLEELRKCAEYALRGNAVAVMLTGPRGSGKAFHIRKISQITGVPLLEIDADMLPADESALSGLMDDICLLQKASFSIVCLRHYTSRLKDCAARLLEASPFLAITVSSVEEPPRFERDTLVAAYETEPLTHSERFGLWMHYLDMAGINLGFDLRAISNQYRLSAGDIENAVNSLALRRAAGMTCAQADLRAITQRQTFSRLRGGLARLVRPRFSWDDLILPEEITARLYEICQRVKYTGRVMDEWGFHSKYPYGSGLSALFYGAPGTGKTMAAHVLASELQIPLLHVDFSNMIDKYIGETEKHINELFSQARQMSAILFFDEADALFAKRSEVSDATDRYANAQTACLLQGIEEYDGIVILSTNLLSNFDDAFRRRIRYFLHFFHPDEQARRLIWQSAFPPQAKLSPDVDMALLARRELSAGSIKNIVLTSAYLAAGSGCIGMEHIAAALRIEQMKESQTGGGHVFDEWM